MQISASVQGSQNIERQMLVSKDKRKMTKELYRLKQTYACTPYCIHTCIEAFPNLQRCSHKRECMRVVIAFGVFAVSSNASVMGFQLHDKGCCYLH